MGNNKRAGSAGGGSHFIWVSFSEKESYDKMKPTQLLRLESSPILRKPLPYPYTKGSKFYYRSYINMWQRNPDLRQLITCGMLMYYGIYRFDKMQRDSGLKEGGALECFLLNFYIGSDEHHHGIRPFSDLWSAGMLFVEFLYWKRRAPSWNSPIF